MLRTADVDLVAGLAIARVNLQQARDFAKSMHMMRFADPALPTEVWSGLVGKVRVAQRSTAGRRPPNAYVLAPR